MTTYLPKAPLRRRLRIALELLRGHYSAVVTYSPNGERTVLLRPHRTEDPMPPVIDGYYARRAAR
jgi:hypothetical protein